ncbi:hypothetical protein CDEST_00744 [Colletotrichum destructivum]|uniref:Uncharacterized protein n=1 Tax=Colletotrichum destructivum TaxID=34406 RepID=A0AAX4HXA4_9PEZI|nr:hypothetical protein CDEST_00744 [Colletotrichum destructivum]
MRLAEGCPVLCGFPSVPGPLNKTPCEHLSLSAEYDDSTWYFDCGVVSTFFPGLAWISHLFSMRQPKGL